MADYELDAKLDDKQVLASLKKIDRAVDDVGSKGEEAFDDIAKGSKSSSLAIGAFAGVVTVAIGAFIELGKRAAAVFKEIAVESAKLAQIQGAAEGQVEARIKSTGGAAGLSLNQIKAMASELQSLTNFGDEAILDAQALLLTFTNVQGDIFQRATATALDLSAAFDQSLKSSSVQLGKALNDPIQGVTALQRVGVSFTESQKEQIKTLVESNDIYSAQKIILAELEKQVGGSAEAARAADGGFTAFKNTIGDLQETLGQPIFESASGAMERLNELLADNSTELTLIAGAIGDVVGMVIDLVAAGLTDWIDNIDSQKILNFILDTGEAINTISELIKTLGEFDVITPLILDNIRGIGDDIAQLNDLLEQTNKLFVILRTAATTDIADIADIAQGVVSGQIRDMESLVARLDESSGGAISRLDEPNERVGALNQATEDRKAALDDLANAEAVAQSRVNETASVMKETAEATEEAAKAQEKYNEARGKYEIDKERAAQDLSLKQQRALLDAEIEFAQKREDLARKNAQKIEDIYRKNVQRIADAAVDLRRDEEDIARKGARQQIEIEREQANRRIEIEVDFRRELERIRARFDFDAQEAIRNNDAIAFLRIQRQKDFELSQARTQRDEEVQDAESAAVEQRQKLQEQLQLQIEDARIANQRKLEDLRVSLQREIQEQQIRYAREIQEAKIAEQRKRDELARTFQRAQEDFQRFWDRKLQDLIRNYQKELQIIQQYEAQKARLMAQSRARATSGPSGPGGRTLRQSNPGQPTGVGVGVPSVATGSNPLTQTNYGNPNSSDPFERLNNVGPGRRFGGRVTRGLPYIVGEPTPELFVPDQNGTIYPNNRLRFNPAMSGVVNNITNTRQTNFNVDALMNMLSPQQVAIVQQIFTQLGMSLYS